ncbi:uncharacterized protein LOC9654262 [Selaginella moellendorffii]|nr:uncharacterized protein LOC9654262 [Selaginella moellendorffii]|eukprot:XP_002964328.2 uncharacterized protein LOC9654262 [Selaginella moellendorffii]
MSCNGCRVLRKGCSDGCVLRQCLRWIESPDAQGHATVFVAKFFGRAGMMALISSVPESQRPALFQSLLYEACGRTINPVFGAVGLLCSGSWKHCQDAVETVLKGGLLCSTVSTGTGRLSSAFGTGRPSIGFVTPSQSQQAFASGRLPKVRLGRGYFSTVTAAAAGAFSIYSCTKDTNNDNSATNAQGFSLDGSKFAGVKRALDRDSSESSSFASLQRRHRSAATTLKVELQEQEEPDEHFYEDEDQGRGSGGGVVHDRRPHAMACGSGRRDHHAVENDGGAAAAVVVEKGWRPGGDEVGLDLTLGSSSSKMSSKNSHRHLVASSSVAAKRTSPASPCHSSEADSDTTDLSISMQSQSNTVAARALPPAPPPLPSRPTTPPSPPPRTAQEVLSPTAAKGDLLLMDLLH